MNQILKYKKHSKQKNQAVNEKHSVSDAPLGKLEFIIQAFGNSADECSKQYELWDVVFEFLQRLFKKYHVMTHIMILLQHFQMQRSTTSRISQKVQIIC